MARQLAIDEVVDFLESFQALEDPRQRGKVLYPLDEVLLLVLLGVTAGCYCWVEIARFGDKKTETSQPVSPVQGRHTVTRSAR